EAVQYVCARAEPNAQLRGEASIVVEHYVKLCGREDIKVTSLSKPNDGCEPGRACYQILQVGRTHFENQAIFAELHGKRPPDAVVRARGVNVAEIYGPSEAGRQVAIRTAGEALRLGELARAFGNASKEPMLVSVQSSARDVDVRGSYRIAA